MIKGRVGIFSAILYGLVVSIGLARANPLPVQAPELNTILMQSTFRIDGPAKGQPGKISFGTAFLMGKPSPHRTKMYYVLISAGHVFDSIDGQFATLTLRVKHADGSYTQTPWRVRLRDAAGHALYVKPNDADVAALYVDMPDNLDVPILPTSMLAQERSATEI